MLFGSVCAFPRRAYNPNLPTYACRALGCSLPDLEDTLYGRLCANISTALERTAAAKASKKRGRAAGNGAGDGDGSGLEGSMEGGAYGGGSEEEGDGERVGVDEEMILDAGEVLLLGGGGGGSEEFGTAGGYGGDSEQGVGWEQQGSEWAGDQVWDGGEEREQGGEEDQTEEPEGGEPEWSEAAMERDWHGPHGHQGASRWGSEARGVQAAAGSRQGQGQGRGQAVVPQDPLELVAAMLGVQPLRRVREAAPGEGEAEGGLGGGGQQEQEQDDWVF